MVLPTFVRSSGVGRIREDSWSRCTLLLMSLLGTIDDVVAAYREHLSRANAGPATRLALKRYNSLLRASPDAAHAEAAMYDFLDHCHLEPTNLEHPSEGGPDFECHRGNDRFAVEVTSIGETTLT